MYSTLLLSILAASSLTAANPAWPSSQSSVTPTATALTTEPTCTGMTPAEQLAAGILINIDWQVHELA